MKNTRNKYLIKNTTIFTISNFSTKIISFLLIPLYTWKLTKADYGIVDLLFTISTFLYPVLTLNIVEAVFRFSMDKDKNDKKIIYNGVLCNIIGIILGLLVIPVLFLFKNYSNYSFLFYIYLITLAMSQTLLCFLKGQEKLRLFAIGNVLNTLFIALFNLLFLLVFDMSIKGYFLAYILSNVLIIIYCIIFGKIKIDLNKKNYDKELLKKMLKYSIVLLPTSFMWWIMNSSDRIMIVSLIGNAANGLYGVSYKIPSLLTMIASIFNQAWIFSAINEKDSADYEKYTNSIFSNFIVILSLSGMVILGLLKIVFKIYVAPSYYDAWKYVPFLIFGYVIMTSATFISTSYNVHKDSKGFLFSGLSGAITNIVLNFILIPLYGIYGAAIATVCSYLVVLIYRLIDTRKYIKIHFNFKYIFILLLLLISCVATYFDIYINVIWCGISVLLVIICFKDNIIFIIKSLINIVKKKK